MIKGSCHCGNVQISLVAQPKWLVECNCSICHKISALWGHVAIENVSIVYNKAATIAYCRGEKTMAFHTCGHCGCTTHWENLNPQESSRMAVNFRMCSADIVKQFKIRSFDGADTWQYLD